MCLSKGEGKSFSCVCVGDKWNWQLKKKRDHDCMCSFIICFPTNKFLIPHGACLLDFHLHQFHVLSSSFLLSLRLSNYSERTLLCPFHPFHSHSSTNGTIERGMRLQCFSFRRFMFHILRLYRFFH